MARFDITLAGEANLDLLLYGLPEDLPVEREWLADRMALTLGGSPAITAHNLAAMGSRVGFVTPVGNDPFAALCMHSLEEAGVELKQVRVQGSAKTGISILLEHAHSRRTLTYPGVTAALRYDDLDLEFLGASRHFHYSSYFLQQGLKADAVRLLAWCKKSGLTTSVDMNDDPAGEWGDSALELLRYVDVFMPNDHELCRITREEDPDAAIRILSERVPLLVVKRGKRGALARRGAEQWIAPGLDVQVVDAVGAGDSFNAGFLHGFVQAWPVERCLRFGNLAGAYSTLSPGGVEGFRHQKSWKKYLAENFDAASSASDTRAFL